MMNLSSKSSAMLLVAPRRFFVKSTRPWQDRLKPELDRYKSRRLKMAYQLVDKKPNQFVRPALEKEPIIKTKERKLLSLAESRLPYAEYSQKEINAINNFETWYDPNFNPHLHEERNRVDPSEEPFSAIYADEQTKDDDQYTSVRNITSPELWSCVEDLKRQILNPPVRLRKPGEPIEPMPSGWVPPPEQPPDLPYFIARTRGRLLPVYYYLHSDQDSCRTIVKKITGDLWKLEEDLRIHLESLLDNKQRILTSVQEPDGVVVFKGRYLHQIVDWLHKQGF